MRETNITNLRVYWKSMAEMYIPLSLLESTLNSEKQIFEAISLEEIRSLMQQYKACLNSFIDLLLEKI